MTLDHPSTSLSLTFLSPACELLGDKGRDAHLLNPTSTQQAKQKKAHQTYGQKNLYFLTHSRDL